MKVNNYQIEVMWLFLATMFCRMTNESEVVYTDSNDRNQCYFTKDYNIEKVRPPP
jgi:hypothetical protein